jgi:hypothetical protein
MAEAVRISTRIRKWKKNPVARIGIAGLKKTMNSGNKQFNRL